MPLINADEFRERFDIDTDIKDGRIVPHIGSASRRLRGWVGSTVYDAAAAVQIGAESEDDTVNDLRNAEAHLTYHFALLGLNSPMAAKGIVTQARTNEGGGREIRQYLEPDKTAALAEMFLEQARELAGPYLASSDDSGVIVIASECHQEAATDPAWCGYGEYRDRC